MYTLEQLKKQNKDITNLIEILEALIKDEKLMQNPLSCELLSQFNEKVWTHLVFEDKTIYAELCKHHNPDINGIVKEFHTSSKELKSLFAQHVKNWRNKSTENDQYDLYYEQSKHIFSLIKIRVKTESEKIFPIVEQHYNS